MAKSKPDWIKARALYEAGKSLRDIANETFIDHSRIGKIAKKEGWERIPEIPQLISDAVSVAERKATLLPQQLEIVDKGVEKQLEELEKKRKYQEFLENATHKNLTHMMSKVVPHKDKNGIVIDPQASVSEHVQAQNALNRGAELLLGKNPDTVINNTNAQQNNSQAEMLKEIAERLPV